MEGDENRIYRQALGCFATGVCVISIDGPKGLTAITVNSFTSVSLHPRLILWCLDNGSDRYAQFANAETFGVTVLAAEQQSVSARFATPGSGGLEEAQVERWDGTPVLRSGLVRLACRTVERLPQGDHLVIVGGVHRFASNGGDGLTYFRGRYGLAQEPAA